MCVCMYITNEIFKVSVNILGKTLQVVSYIDMPKESRTSGQSTTFLVSTREKRSQKIQCPRVK